MDITVSNVYNIGFWGIICANNGIKGTPLMLGLLAVVLLCSAVGYLCGSINPAIFLSKRLYGRDIRECGSGNAGMTNMFRTFGKKAGLLTLLGDSLKTAAAVVFGYLVYGVHGAWIAGLFCVVGHMFPAFYRFRGGKGVLVTAVLLLLTDWPVLIVSLIVFAIVLIGTKMVSLASIMSALMMPLLLNAYYAAVAGSGAAAGIRSPIAILIAAAVIVRHYGNIRRIREGKEPKINIGKKK